MQIWNCLEAVEILRDNWLAILSVGNENCLDTLSYSLICFFFSSDKREWDILKPALYFRLVIYADFLFDTTIKPNQTYLHHFSCLDEVLVRNFYESHFSNFCNIFFLFYRNFLRLWMGYISNLKCKERKQVDFFFWRIKSPLIWSCECTW